MPDPTRSTLRPGLRAPGIALLALVAGWWIAALPAAADWLVTEDGARVETKGPWEVRGKLVIFTRPDGTLASVRLDRVDLEASKAATETAKKPPPEKPRVPAKPKKPVLVLTDADIGPARARPPAEGGAGEGAGSGGAGSAEQPALEVVSWNTVDQGGSPNVQIVGSLRNNSDEIVTGVVMIVRLYDADDKLIAETPALFNPNSLAPRGSVNFRSLFPGVYGFVRASFEIKSSGGWVFTRPPEAPPEEEIP